MSFLQLMIWAWNPWRTSTKRNKIQILRLDMLKDI